ncbi:MAG: hypothetical protein RDU59_09420 [Thermodesulfobacteriota bacterium]|nr:hypothetical protein [Thermodesulfobacteriota bacterium]
MTTEQKIIKNKNESIALNSVGNCGILPLSITEFPIWLFCYWQEI